MVERVVITGMGAISPLGLSAKESWENAVRGLSGVGPITLFDPADYLVRIACEVKNFQPEAYMDAKEARRRDRFEQFASAAGQEAIAQAGLQDGKRDPGRVGVIVSSSIGGLGSLQEGIYTIKESGPRRVSPFLIPMLMPNGGAGLIGIDYRLYRAKFFVGVGLCFRRRRDWYGVADAAKRYY